MTLQPRCEEVETSEGVPISISCIAQCKIMNEKELLTIACEQFLGKSVNHIKSVILQTLEGHLRGILGTLTVEEIYRERDQFASLVREVASPDIGRMGVEILSFTIKDVSDSVHYLESLGKAKIADVKRNAQVGIANCERDARIKEIEYEKSTMDIKYATDIKIEESHRQFLLQSSNYEKEINSMQAEAKLAYDLESAKQNQLIATETKKLELIEKQKQTLIVGLDGQCNVKDNYAKIHLTADSESYRVQQIARGQAAVTRAVAEAESERITKISEAEAKAIKSRGQAEVEQMRMKAAAYKQFGEAAILALTLEALPKVSIRDTNILL